MMPSVIPARLQFQCGHAALVTLPRVKGETATQRNDRVAREKSAALSRQCDFCAPVNGAAHVEVADAVEASPVEELAVIVSAVPEPEPTPEPIAATLVEVPEPAQPETNGVATAKPTRKTRARRQPARSGQEFVVEYRLERVVRAGSIREALQQAAGIGATNVIAITRED
jgi:hypothetical protein